MNGLFLNLPLYVRDHITMNQYNKQIINFDSHTQNNLLLITKISEIENSIIHYYKKIHENKKRSNLALTTQLFNGYFKIFKDHELQSKKSKSNKNTFLKFQASGKTKKKLECPINL